MSANPFGSDPGLARADHGVDSGDQFLHGRPDGWRGISHADALARLLDATNAAMALLLRGEDVRKAAPIVSGREQR